MKRQLVIDEEISKDSKGSLEIEAPLLYQAWINNHSDNRTSVPVSESKKKMVSPFGAVILTRSR